MAARKSARPKPRTTKPAARKSTPKRAAKAKPAAKSTTRTKRSSSGLGRAARAIGRAAGKVARLAPRRKPKARGVRKAARAVGRAAARLVRLAPAKKKPRPAAPSGAPKATAAVPNGIGLVNHHLDYSTHDVKAVRRFYVEQLGFTQANEMPGTPYLSIQTGASSSLGFGPPQPGPPENWSPPREPALYFIVEDVDRAHRTLTAKSVAFESTPADMPWGHRAATLRDPEGRLVYLAQILKR